jgi:hypothetical protein
VWRLGGRKGKEGGVATMAMGRGEYKERDDAWGAGSGQGCEGGGLPAKHQGGYAKKKQVSNFLFFTSE